MPCKVVNPSEEKTTCVQGGGSKFLHRLFHFILDRNSSEVKKERWRLDRQLCCLLLYFNTRKIKLTILSPFFHDICDFSIQDDSPKEERRDQRGRPRGKQRESKRKGRNQGRRHGREEASPGKREIANEFGYVGLRVRE